MSQSELIDVLHYGLIAMDQPLDRHKEIQLIHYIDLIGQWNRQYNLSSIRDLDTMVVRHLLDSLFILVHIEGNSILDVGTGAGLPGIPLAIAMPDRKFVVLDSNGKKTKFLKQVCFQMRLTNVRVVHQRVEDYFADPLFDTVISKAFSTLRDFLSLSQHLIKPDGQFLAMKGVFPLSELQEIKAPFKLTEATPLKIPGLDADRHVVDLRYQPEMMSV